MHHSGVPNRPFTVSYTGRQCLILCSVSNTPLKFHHSAVTWPTLASRVSKRTWDSTIRNMPPRCPSCSPDISLCVTPANSSSATSADHGIQMQVPSNLVMNTVPTPRLYLALVTVTWGLISALTAVGNDSTPAVHALMLSYPAALSKLFPHCCLPFLPRFCRQVGCVFLPSTRSHGYHRGCVLSRCYLLPLPMVYQERSRLQDRSVRITKTIKPYFINSLLGRLNVGNMMAQGLGGLIAAGVLSGLEGARGIRGWRWVGSFLLPVVTVSSPFAAFYHRRFHHHRLWTPCSLHPCGLSLRVGYLFVLPSE